MARTFDGLSRQQLLVYARELSEHVEEEDSLRRQLTERERQVADLVAACIAAQEEERQWIALEVHDRIAQNLAAVFHQLQVLESMTLPDARANGIVLRASTLVREAIRESRSIMNDLDPPGLAEYGLSSLLSEELRRLQEDTGCQVKLDDDCQVRPSHDVEVTLYRIFHEAVINIRKHAPEAGKVFVSLTCDQDAVHLQIEDDGPGFDVEAEKQAKRVGGLVSMQRRVSILGGIFEATSAIGKGTKLAIVVPSNGGWNKASKPE